MDYQGGSGGGFNNGGGGGFAGNNLSSQGSGSRTGGARKSYDEQTITPCTIGMLLNSIPEAGGGDSGGALELADGRKLHHVSIVGAIRDITENSTNVLIGLEDGTGLVSIKQWLDQNDCSAKYELRSAIIKKGENVYVKVIGSPKYYDGNIQLIADSVRHLSSGNELVHHMLDTIYTGEKYKAKHSIMPPRSLMGSNYGVGFGANSTATPLQARSLNTARGGVGGTTQDDVLHFIRTEGAVNQDMGVNVKQVVNYLRNQHSEKEIRSAISELATGGFIYSTLDEEHYQFAL
jgi:replication factor A2